ELEQGGNQPRAESAPLGAVPAGDAGCAGRGDTQESSHDEVSAIDEHEGLRRPIQLLVDRRADGAPGATVPPGQVPGRGIPRLQVEVTTSDEVATGGQRECVDAVIGEAPSATLSVREPRAEWTPLLAVPSRDLVRHLASSDSEGATSDQIALRKHGQGAHHAVHPGAKGAPCAGCRVPGSDVVNGYS